MAMLLTYKHDHLLSITNYYIRFMADYDIAVIHTCHEPTKVAALTAAFVIWRGVYIVTYN